MLGKGHSAPSHLTTLARAFTVLSWSRVSEGNTRALPIERSWGLWKAVPVKCSVTIPQREPAALRNSLPCSCVNRVPPPADVSDGKTSCCSVSIPFPCVLPVVLCFYFLSLLLHWLPFPSSSSVSLSKGLLRGLLIPHWLGASPLSSQARPSCFQQEASLACDAGGDRAHLRLNETQNSHHCP